MAEMIKSFEEANSGVFGDLLTGGKRQKPFKAGLLTCGYFEYWRMYPESLRENVQADLRLAEERFAGMFKSAVLSGMVDTLDSADAAGRRFKAEDIDILVVVCGTYMPDFITLHTINYVKNVPLVLFSVQGRENIDVQGDYEHSLRNSSLIGISQLSGTLAKMKREYQAVVGSLHDGRAWERLAAMVRAAKAVAEVREANIGVIGNVFRGMYDLELSKTFLKSTFDVNIIYIQSSHLLQQWQAVTEKEAAQEAEKLMARFKVKSVEAVDVQRAMRLAIAMERLADAFCLDALCFLDQHFLQKQMGTSARIGASLLMERTGRVVNCEGDLGGLVMMLLMRSLTGCAGLMAEWGEYDLASNSCLLMGHGIGTPQLAAGEEQVQLTRTPEEWGFTGSGLNYQLQVRPGPATIGHFIEMPDGYKMLLSGVESIGFPPMDYDELYGVVKVQKPVREYLEELLQSGVSHHCILGLGNVCAELEQVARLLGVKCFRV